MVVIVRYIDITAVVHGHTKGILELAVATTRTAPLGHKNTVAVELLDTLVVFIHCIDITAAVHGHTVGVIELAVIITIAAPLG